MVSSRIKTLVLYAQITDKLSYYDDWKDAFLSFREFDAMPVNIIEKAGIKIVDNSIGDYDLIVLLHSTNGGGVNNIVPYKDVLLKRKGKLLVLVGNEVNIPHISMRGKIDFICDIGAEFIGTQLLPEAGRWLFEDCKNSQVVSLPPALNPDAFKPLIELTNRRIDIGVRSNRYLPHMGDNERNELFDFFRSYRSDPPIIVNISTEERFDRKGWAGFLNRCKGTVANEAGTYYLERDDRTVRKVQSYIEEKAVSSASHVISDDPKSHPLLWKILPVGMRRNLRKLLCPLGIISKRELYKLIEYEDIYDRFYKDYGKTSIYSKCVSSRHFDAIGTKTCQIMLDGRYNDILKADEHYIALRHDFSNIEDVIKRFRDVSYRKAMVDRAYDYIMDTNTYRHRMSFVAGLVR